MPKFFVNRAQIENGYVTLTGDDAHHISRALRMAAGERITVSDMQMTEYECVLEDFSEGSVRARIESERQADTELCVRVHLFQALPKGEKLDLVIQKSVECGVYDITPFESERCIVRCKAEAEERKTERRNKIALEAAKQSGRGVVPTVRPTLSFDRMLAEAKKSDAVIFCYEGEGTASLGKILSEIKGSGATDISIIIGSEGGFSISEAEMAEKNGFFMAGLGKKDTQDRNGTTFYSCLHSL